MTADQLRGPTGVFRRWCRWRSSYSGAASSTDTAATPSAETLACWLASVAEGGATAAAGVSAQLKWLVDHLGLPFPILQPALKSFRKVTADYKPMVQSHEVWTVPALCSVMAFLHGAIGGGAVALLTGFLLLQIASCLRFKHLQLSSFVAASPRLLRGWCLRGKRRVRGARPPFGWAAPRCLLPGADLLQGVVTYLECRPPGLKWMIPDFEGSTLDTLHSGTVLKNSPCPRAKFVTFTQSLLTHLDLPTELARCIGTRDARRTLATLGLELNIPPRVAGRSRGLDRAHPNGQGNHSP
jgi:hypothetical protein